MDDVQQRLERIEQALAELVRQTEFLLQQQPIKDLYSTAEAASILGRAEYTVREWCRLGRVHAVKKPCGRGQSQEWAIAHAELVRLRNEGILPLPKHAG